VPGNEPLETIHPPRTAFFNRIPTLKSWFANVIIGSLNGIVELWGWSETGTERDALMLAAR